MAVFNPQLVQLVRQTLQSLKRQYGGAAVLCSVLHWDTDYRTGNRSVAYTTHPVARAIVLPSHMTRDLVLSTARISMNKPLAYGGEYNIGDRGFIIDGDDLPKGTLIKKDDWIVYRSERYDVKTISKVVGGTAWAVVARKLPGQPHAFDLQSSDAVPLSDHGDPE